jgi:hypothetical protein
MFCNVFWFRHSPTRWENPEKGSGFSGKPENDNHWNRLRYELSPIYLFRSSICKPGTILKIEHETFSPVKVGLQAGVGQRPVGYLAIYGFDDRTDSNL